MNKTYHWNRYFLSRDDPELTLLSPFSQISHNAASRYAIAILCESEREKEKSMCYFRDDEFTACSLAIQKIHLLNLAQLSSQAKRCLLWEDIKSH
jgi:hypothetical protein